MSISGKQKGGINIFVKNISDRKSSLTDKRQAEEFPQPSSAEFQETQSTKTKTGLSDYIAVEPNYDTYDNNNDNSNANIGAEDVNKYEKNYNNKPVNNNNYSPNFSSLIHSFNTRTTKTPFVIAFMFSLSWVAVVITMLVDENTIREWQQILTLNIISETKGAFFSLFSIVAFPIGFFWALATMVYIAKGNRNAIKTIVKASLLVSQPQKQAGRAINSITAIVKKDVNDINQTVEKAFKKTMQIQEIIDNQIQTINHSCFQQKNMLDNIIEDMNKQKNALIASMEELQVKSTMAFKPMARENIRIKNVVSESLEHVDSATANLRHNLEKFHQLTTKIVTVSEENCANIENTVENLQNVFNTGSNRIENTVELFEIQNQKLENFSNALKNTTLEVEHKIEQKQQNIEQLMYNIGQKGEEIVDNVESGARRFLMHVENAQNKINLIKDYLQNKGSEDTKQSVLEFERLVEKISEETNLTMQKIQQGYSETIDNIQQQSKNAAIALNKDIQDMNSMAQLTAQDIAITKDKIDIAIKQIPRTAEKTNEEIKKFIEKQAENIKNMNDEFYQTIKKNAANNDKLYNIVKENADVNANNANSDSEPDSQKIKQQNTKFQTNVKDNIQYDNNKNSQNKWGLNQLLSNARKAEKDQREKKLLYNNKTKLPDFSWNANDLVKAFNDVDLGNIWKRYNQGDHNVFNKSIYNSHGASLFDEIKSRYDYDHNFRNDIDQYLDEFEGLLTTETHSGKNDHVLKTYLTSETGKIYMLLAHAAGRFE